MGITIPDAAVLDMPGFQADWEDWILGRGGKPAFFRDRVAYFMLGANEWRYAPTLKAASSGSDATFCLSDAAGTPPDLFHSGELVPTAPRAQPPAIVVSDPHEVPEVGMAQYVPDEDLTSQFRDFQKRAIVFHSEPLAQDMEVAGHMRLWLVTQANAPDFDLWAQVLMVMPGWIDDPAWRRHPTGAVPGWSVYGGAAETGADRRDPVRVFWMARRIPAGARIRVTIAPLNSPSNQKNYNTGGRIGYEKIEDARVATIGIFHDAARPSCLFMPLAAPPRVPAPQ